MPHFLRSQSNTGVFGTTTTFGKRLIEFGPSANMEAEELMSHNGDEHPARSGRFVHSNMAAGQRAAPDKLNVDVSRYKIR